MSKRKVTKVLQANGSTAEEDDSPSFVSADIILSFVHKMTSYKNDLSYALRPAKSLIVNNNCLRPHGVLQNGGVNSGKLFCEPCDSFLQDIVAMVNNSQKLLRRGSDFSLVADSEDIVNVLNMFSFWQWWRDTVSKECKSVSAFPYTSFCFLGPQLQDLTNNSTPAACEPNSCKQTAEIIYRILCVFADVSNNAQWDFHELLFHVLQNEKASINGLLSANYNSRHITVCCGLYFYSLDVLDDDGSIISADLIAERLQAVKKHADCTERILRQKTLLPDALEDLIEFHKLLGSLTEIDKVDCAAIMERLKNADPANATSLATIDAGIFTVILRGFEDNNAAFARWYRSSLVLEEGESAGVFRLRGHSIIIHREKLMEFLTRIFSVEVRSKKLAKTITAVEIVPPKKEEKEEVTEEDGTHIINNNNNDGDCDCDNKNLPLGVKQLEMWLPWKHRKVIRPYKKPLRSPHIFSLLISRENHISFACLCISAVIAVQQILKSPNEFPSVLLAFPSVQGGLSTALLYSYEVEAFIQSFSCGSALINQRTIRHLVKRALESLEKIIDACFQERFPMYSMANMLLAKKKAVASDSVADGSFLGTVDFCITVGMLGSSGKVLGCETNLLLPSRFALMCCATGDASPPPPRSGKWGPSGVNVISAVLKALDESEDTLSVGERLTECIKEKSLQLLSLLSNVD